MKPLRASWLAGNSLFLIGVACLAVVFVVLTVTCAATLSRDRELLNCKISELAGKVAALETGITRLTAVESETAQLQAKLAGLDQAIAKLSTGDGMRSSNRVDGNDIHHAIERVVAEEDVRRLIRRRDELDQLRKKTLAEASRKRCDAKTAPARFLADQLLEFAQKNEEEAENMNQEIQQIDAELARLKKPPNEAANPSGGSGGS